MKIEIEFTTPDELVSRLRVLLNSIIQHSDDTVLVAGNFRSVSVETAEETIQRKDEELQCAHEQIEALNNHVSELKIQNDRLGFSNVALRRSSSNAAKWFFEIYDALVEDKNLFQYGTEEHYKVLNRIAELKGTHERRIAKPTARNEGK